MRSEAASREAAAQNVPAQRDSDAALVSEARAQNPVNCVGTWLCMCGGRVDLQGLIFIRYAPGGEPSANQSRPWRERNGLRRNLLHT